jgi:hypothetical protein
MITILSTLGKPKIAKRNVRPPVEWDGSREGLGKNCTGLSAKIHIGVEGNDVECLGSWFLEQPVAILPQEACSCTHASFSMTKLMADIVSPR